MVLEAIGHLARVSARVDLEAVRDPVRVEGLVELAGIDPQAVLIAHVHRDRAVLPEVADVLIDEGERRVRGPLREDVRLRRAILRRQVEVERRILRVGRPCRRRGQLRSREERQDGAVGGRSSCRRRPSRDPRWPGRIREAPGSTGS